MEKTSQRGSSALIMVIMMLLMGTMLLHATRQQLAESISVAGDEQRYLQQFIQARSALAWGERLTWPAAEQWHCQYQAGYHWRACFQPQHQLLRADSGPDTLALWRRVMRQPGAGLGRQPHGWIDFCPLPEEESCHVE